MTFEPTPTITPKDLVRYAEELHSVENTFENGCFIRGITVNFSPANDGYEDKWGAWASFSVVGDHALVASDKVASIYGVKRLSFTSSKEVYMEVWL